LIFVLDTNVVSDLRRKRPHPLLVEWAERSDPDDLATTVVTVHEIQRGIERTRRSSSSNAAAIEAWLEEFLAMGNFFVLPMNVDAWRLLGQMYETPPLRHFLVTDPRAKTSVTAADLAIAAIAIVSGHAIATRDIRHFLQIHAHFPLPGLFDPFGGVWHIQATDPTP
jgi:predicted nucleic acid-binding protein